MRSLNPSWTSAGFHARIAELARVADGDRVLDLGCGRGLTIPSLLAKVGIKGHVVAADRDDLEPIVESFRRAFDEARLSVQTLDLGRPLPFAAASFERVVCQDVIECIREREHLVAEMKRVLRPGGTALVGHHDFDGAMIASDDRLLTRKLVNGFADHTQKWQDVSEGQMGRLLPGLVAGCGFTRVETETVLFVELDIEKDVYARVHLDGIVGLAEAYGVAKDQAMAWLDALKRRCISGSFYYAVPWVYVVAEK